MNIYFPFLRKINRLDENTVFILRYVKILLMKQAFALLIFILLFSCGSENEDKDNSSCRALIGCSEEVAPDTTPPSLISVVAPVDGSYTSGQVLAIDFKYDEPVSLSGSLAIDLKIGRYTKSATCIEFSVDTIRCSYTLIEDGLLPDIDFDGIEVGSVVGAGKIKDNGDNEIELDFLPLDLSGIHVGFENFDHWIDINDSTTVFSDAGCSTLASNNDEVKCVTDKRSSKKLLNTTPNNKPIYQTGLGSNNTDTLLFARDFLSFDSPVTLTPNFTIFVIYNVTEWSTLNYLFSSASSTTGGVGMGFGGTYSSPVGGGLFMLSKATGGSATKSVTTTVEDKGWYLASFSNSKIFRNGIESAPYTNSDILDLPQSFSNIGGRDDRNSCCDHQGNVSEIMIYNQELSPEERDEIWCALSEKYNLNITGC